MTPDPTKKIDWSEIGNVFELLETKDRKLTDGEKKIIAGQRKIKRDSLSGNRRNLADIPG